MPAFEVKTLEKWETIAFYLVVAATKVEFINTLDVIVLE